MGLGGLRGGWGGLKNILSGGLPPPRTARNRTFLYKNNVLIKNTFLEKGFEKIRFIQSIHQLIHYLYPNPDYI